MTEETQTNIGRQVIILQPQHLNLSSNLDGVRPAKVVRCVSDMVGAGYVVEALYEIPPTTGSPVERAIFNSDYGKIWMWQDMWDSGRSHSTPSVAIPEAHSIDVLARVTSESVIGVMMEGQLIVSPPGAEVSMYALDPMAKRVYTEAAKLSSSVSLGLAIPDDHNREYLICTLAHPHTRVEIHESAWFALADMLQGIRMSSGEPGPKIAIVLQGLAHVGPRRVRSEIEGGEVE